MSTMLSGVFFKLDELTKGLQNFILRLLQIELQQHKNNNTIAMMQNRIEAMHQELQDTTDAVLRIEKTLGIMPRLSIMPQDRVATVAERLNGE